MAALTAEKIAKELCVEWGIDPTRVAGVIIELNPASVATAIIKYYLDSDAITILKSYKLVLKESE